MPVPCSQADRIMKMEVNITRIMGIIDDKGSSNPGLYQTVILLANNQIEQGKNIDKLMRIVETLKESGIKTDAEDKLISRLTKEKQNYKQWIIGLVVAIVIAIAGFVISMSTKNKSNVQTEQTVNH